METEEKKPEMKAEPKEEEESGANSTSTTSNAQNRKKSLVTPFTPLRSTSEGGKYFVRVRNETSARAGNKLSIKRRRNSDYSSIILNT